jgi:hypothetical protein
MENRMNTTLNERIGHIEGAGSAVNQNGHLAAEASTALRHYEPDGKSDPSGPPPTTSSTKKRLTRAIGAIAAAAVMVGAGVYYCRFVMPF